VTDNIIAAGLDGAGDRRIGDLLSGWLRGHDYGGQYRHGWGFERFCVAAETDISNASRAIKSDELDACRANGREPISFYIGIDALAIAVSAENTFVEDLTTEQLALIFSPPKPGRIQANLAPADQLFQPGNGTYDYFVEHVFDQDSR
jgi:ABC-type phosphate transport system substrate-binding protein